MVEKLANRLIDSLPHNERAHLMGLLHPVPLPIRTPLFPVGATPRYVHFITSGIASVVTALPSGEAVEAGITGFEGFPEALHLIGPQTMDSRSFMQMAGTGLRMDYKRFREEFDTRAPLREAVLRLVQYQSFMTSQLVACNCLHNVEQRLARWLLMVADRTGSQSIHLTQEFLAEMIGARRSTVTVAAGAIQKTGSIEYRRGLVRILDRKSLIRTACECYPVTLRLLNDLYK